MKEASSLLDGSWLVTTISRQPEKDEKTPKMVWRKMLKNYGGGREFVW